MWSMSLMAYSNQSKGVSDGLVIEFVGYWTKERCQLECDKLNSINKHHETPDYEVFEMEVCHG
jgi:hypothetical protein